MREAPTSDLKARERRDLRSAPVPVLAGLTASHGVFHWLIQSFLVMLPQVKDAFGLSPVQIGAIITVREMVSGAVTLPGGIVADRVRRHWGLLMAICIGGFGLGWLLVGLSPIYPLLLIGMGLVSMSGSIWHLPAMASLSHRFARTRGVALSIHGIGGSIGDVVGPVLTGFLLGILAWRGVISIYAIAPLFLGFVVFWAFRDIGRARDLAPPPTNLKEQMRFTRRLLRNRTLWGVNFVAGLRGMSYTAFTTFLPLYIGDELGLSSRAVGFYIGLMVLVGVVTAPAMGYLSDRLGRKQILVPIMLSLCGLTFLLVTFGQGVMLPVLIGLLGLFLYSDQPILTATALDIVGHAVPTTTLGVLSFTRFTLGAVSPLIAGVLYQTRGIDTTFYYVAGLFAVGAITLFLLPLKRPGTASNE